MEAATAEAPQEQTNGSPPVVADAERTRHDIFRYSEYVHVGPGVEECELFVALADPERDKSRPLPVCSDPDHFHAWCRLPNPFQVRDIAEKASAARARRARMLKDPESDSHAILEAELDSLLDPTLKDIVVEEIIERDFAEDYDDAMRRVKAVEVEDFVPEDEDDETPKLYANIEQDQEEFTRQTRLPEEQRGDDYEELGKTVRAFTDALLTPNWSPSVSRSARTCWRSPSRSWWTSSARSGSATRAPRRTCTPTTRGSGSSAPSRSPRRAVRMSGCGRTSTSSSTRPQVTWWALSSAPSRTWRHGWQGSRETDNGRCVVGHGSHRP
jgi:hypothetical protein